MLYVWQRRLASRPHASVCSMFPYRKYHQHHICYHQTKEAMSHIANITNTTKSGNASLRKFCCHQMVKAKFHIEKATNPIAISSKITAVFPRHASSNINTINTNHQHSFYCQRLLTNRFLPKKTIPA